MMLIFTTSNLYYFGFIFFLSSIALSYYFLVSKAAPTSQLSYNGNLFFVFSNIVGGKKPSKEGDGGAKAVFWNISKI